MNPEELHGELAALAREAGFELRRGGERVGDTDLPLHSGVCRLRGRIWVVLATGDSTEERIATLADALRNHAADWLESRYLPPAVRERLVDD